MIQKPDIFDVIAPEKESSIKLSISTPREPADVKKKMLELQYQLEEQKKELEIARYGKLAEELKAFIREELAKVRISQDVVERIVEKQPIVQRIHIPVPVSTPPPPAAPPAPPQIIKEVRVEVPVKDTRKLVEQETIDELKKKISELEAKLKETRHIAENPLMAPGGSGVIGIPPPEPNPEGYVLTINKGKAKWSAATGGSGSITPSTDVYTVTGKVTDRDFNVGDTTVDELAAVLGSLISTLQGTGIIL